MLLFSLYNPVQRGVRQIVFLGKFSRNPYPFRKKRLYPFTVCNFISSPPFVVNDTIIFSDKLNCFTIFFITFRFYQQHLFIIVLYYLSRTEKQIITLPHLCND